MNNALLSLIRNRLPKKNRFDAMSSDVYHNLFALDFSIIGRDTPNQYYQKLLQLKKKDIELLFGLTVKSEAADKMDYKQLYTEWVRLYKLYFESFPGATPREKARTRFYELQFDDNGEAFDKDGDIIYEYEAEFAVANIFKFLFRSLEVDDSDNAEIEFSDECNNVQSTIDSTVLKYVIWWIITNANKMTGEELNRHAIYKLFADRIFEHYFTSKIIYHVSNLNFLQWYFTNRNKLFQIKNEDGYQFSIENYAAPLKNQSYEKIKFLFGLAIETPDIENISINTAQEIENAVDMLIENNLSSNDIYRLKQELIAEARARGQIE